MHRHRRPGAVGQLTDGELALHLQADDEEEERHQAVVDEVLDRHLEVGLAELKPTGVSSSAE